MENTNLDLLKAMGITEEIYKTLREMRVIRYNGIAILKELLQGHQESKELNPFTSIDVTTSSDEDINFAINSMDLLFNTSDMFGFYIPNSETQISVIKTWLETMKIVRDVYAYNSMEAVYDETQKLCLASSMICSLHKKNTSTSSYAAKQFIDDCAKLQEKYQMMIPKIGEIIVHREYISNSSKI